MRPRYAILWLVVFRAGAAMAQVPSEPAAVDYIYVNGKQIHLSEVKDAMFYRIQALSNLAKDPKIRSSLEEALGMVAVHNGLEEFAVRKSVAMAGKARAAIARLTRTKEADPLRVFSRDGGNTLLVEYPEIILQCAENTTLAEVQQYMRTRYQVTVEPTGLGPGQFLVRLLTPSHTLWLANQLKSTKAIPVRYADVNFWLAQPSGRNPPQFPAQWPAPAGPGLPDDPAFREQWALENRASKPGALKNADIGFARAFRIAPMDA